MGVSCIHLAAAFASLMFILFLSYGETTGGGVPSDAVTAHQEGYGAKEPEGEEKKDVESPELAETERSLPPIDGVDITRASRVARGSPAAQLISRCGAN